MDLLDLYRDVILDHNRKPRNFGPLLPADAQAEGHNPLCGDRLTVSLRMAGECLDEVHFEGKGCAISVASASLMTEAVRGLDRAQFAKLYDTVHTTLTEHDYVPPASLGKLAALGGVREYPARVKCASLCWHTLNAALNNLQSPAASAAPAVATVSTE